MSKKLAACFLVTWLAASISVAQAQPDRPAADRAHPSALRDQQDNHLLLAQESGGEQGGSDAAGEDPDLDVPYVTTPEKVVRRMLDLGQVGPGDYVMDLGSGDGRIVIQAAQRGAYGLGVDLDPERVRDGRENAEKAGVSDDVAFLQQDLFETDVSQASVVTMYLFPEINIELRPVLLEQLRPGARVVSHAFSMGKWEADKTLVVQGQGSDTYRIYLWVIPADAAGQWQWQVDGQRFSWQVKQRFQKLDTTLEAGDSTLVPEEVVLRGRRIAFTTEHEGNKYVFSGRIEDGRINGVVHVRSGDQPRVLDWTARKQQ